MIIYNLPSNQTDYHIIMYVFLHNTPHMEHDILEQLCYKLRF